MHSYIVLALHLLESEMRHLSTWPWRHDDFRIISSLSHFPAALFCALEDPWSHVSASGKLCWTPTNKMQKRDFPFTCSMQPLLFSSRWCFDSMLKGTCSQSIFMKMFAYLAVSTPLLTALGAVLTCVRLVWGWVLGSGFANSVTPVPFLALDQFCVASGHYLGCKWW